MNYGHPLRFGVFITPFAADPEAVVDLAVLSERLGYDLVTFQDHPYQPAFLDTWTLLSWVAARTERVQLAANVHNLPLRPPAMLARAAAGLDLLSGGRVALGIGAGAFWDAIEANGGNRLAPAQAVEALDEAIEVIRGLWEVGDSPTVSYAGEHYRLAGAQPGPVAAHDIPIWIGALKRRMLRLIGRTADGWLPSIGRLAAGDYAAGNAVIDEAAVSAGRDPREIRRLLNISGRFSAAGNGFLQGPPAQWVDQLLPLVVADGVGTFILAADDPDDLRTFAEKVAPALREAADRELPNALLERRIRRTSMLAKRRPGIDYDGLPAALRDRAIEPGDAGFARVRSTYLRGGDPGLVLPARSTDEVVAAVGYAKAHPHLPLSIRSGGHGISGRSTNDGGLVIDVSALDTMRVLDVPTRRVLIGPGARWMDVATFLQPHGWALSSGDYGGVGVGGLATAGGIGFLGRAHGLTIDHLRAVEMVLADGSVVRADSDQHADLFWAVRGAGANFGIVTAFEFEVDQIGDIGWAQLALDATDTADFLRRWGAAVESAPRDLTSFLIMGRPQPGGSVVAHAMSMVDSDSPDIVIDRIQRIADIGPLLQQSVVITSYANVLNNAARGDQHGQGEPITRSALVEHLTAEFAAAAEKLIRSGAVYFFQIRSVGGAVADIDPDATAYAHRSANFSVTAFGANRQRLNRFWDELTPHVNGLYLSFETDLDPARITDAFPPRTLARLRELKHRYDPDNVFRDNFNLTTDSADETADPVAQGSFR